MNSLLTILNERRFHNDGAVMQCPLRTAITASNEVPEDDSLRALYDRLLLRYQVSPLSDTGLASLIVASPVASLPIIPLTLTDLQTAQTEIQTITLPKDIGETYVSLRKSLATEGIVPSDRRLKWSVKFVQANAWLDGRDKTSDEDLEVLIPCFWEEPSQINTVKKIVLKAANPQWIKALELYEAAEQVAATALALTDDRAKMEGGIEAGAKLKKAVERLTKLDGGKAGRVADLIAKTIALYKGVIKECMGMDVTLALPGGNGER